MTVALGLFPAGASAETIYGLVGITNPQTLVRFDSATPATATTLGPITGLQPAEVIEGIDIRPATGDLYGVGSTSRLYDINRASAVATQVGSGQFSPLLDTSQHGFGVDFNPAADRLRVISFGANQNLRLNPDTGAAFLDTPVAPAPGQSVPPMSADPGIAGLAYDGNVPGSTSTTAYAYDFLPSPERLYRLGSPGGSPVSPNTGQLFDVGSVGFASINAANIGLDVSASGTAYLCTATSNLYTVNLATGAATLVGAATPNLSDITAAAVAQSFSFAAASTVVDESAGTADITITRSQGVGQASVHVTSTGGTATPGADYQPVDATVAFPAGQTSAQLPVTLIDDPTPESAKTIELTLSAPSAVGDASVGSQGTTTVVINDHHESHALAIARAGTGGGTVTSSDGQINCGATCSHTYDHGTSVTLNATPDAGSKFTGWSGGVCSGTGPCALTISSDVTPTATFDDTTAPRVKVSGSSTQDIDKLALTFKPNEASRLSGQASVTLPAVQKAKAKVVKSKKAKATLPGPNQKAKLKFKFSKKNLKALKKALKKGKKLKAKVVVTVTDHAGNRTAVKKTVKLKDRR
jgi:uncharacterized protein DUF4394/Calx-beta domain-containing protein/List-Bact-rpt repeat protein